MAQMTSAWDFVEKYYPNYEGSPVIALIGDLDKLVDIEYEDGDSAHKLLIDEYNGNINNPKIRIDHSHWMAYIYETAIEQFIKEQK